MTQKEIIKYYEDNGGLRCKYWSLEEIRDYIKEELGREQRVLKTTCQILKRSAQINQH